MIPPDELIATVERMTEEKRLELISALGLTPRSVRRHAEDVRTLDVVREWLATACVLDVDARTPSSELRDSFEHFRRARGVPVPLSNEGWCNALRAAGARYLRTSIAGKGTTVWVGIRLVNDADDQVESFRAELDGTVTDEWSNEVNHAG